MSLIGMLALVTGITGTVGDRCAMRLIEEGARVRGLIRKADQAARLKEIGVEPVLGELTDRASLDAAMAGVDLVVHSAAYLGADWDLARAANEEGVRNMAEAALAAGVKRFVQISTLSAYGHPASGELDENYPVCTQHANPYPVTKAESERILRQAAGRGLNVVILRPGAICSEENSHWGDKLVQRMAAMEVFNRFHPEEPWPWVHTDNLADMVILAATHPGAVGQAYNAIDGNYPIADFHGRIAAALGKALTRPDRAPNMATYAHEKIKTLGYKPRRTFTETIDALVRQAEALAAGK